MEEDEEEDITIIKTMRRDAWREDQGDAYFE